MIILDTYKFDGNHFLVTIARSFVSRTSFKGTVSLYPILISQFVPILISQFVAKFLRKNRRTKRNLGIELGTNQGFSSCPVKRSLLNE